jgi:hypothetical protein
MSLSVIASVCSLVAVTSNPSRAAILGEYWPVRLLGTRRQPRLPSNRYEPNPKARQWLDQDAASHRIEVRPVVVSQEGGTRHFDPDELNLLARFSDDPSGKVIETIAARDVADGREIEFFKVACVGAEFEIFQDELLLRRTKMIGLEYHLTTTNTMEVLCRLLEKEGHQVKKTFSRGDYGTMWTDRN